MQSSPENLHWFHRQPHPIRRIFLSAGEASGDHYGAQLIAELRTPPSRTPPSSASAARRWKPQARTASSAPKTSPTWASPKSSATAPHLRRIPPPRRLHQTTPPRLAILIDFPDVNFRLARELKKLNIPVIYFVSPQLWAWKRRRLRWVQQRVNRMMVIFPFEDRSTAPATSTPSSSATRSPSCPLPTISREDYAANRTASTPRSTWIALLPGSRWKEVEANLPHMSKLTYRFLKAANYEFLSGRLHHRPNKLSGSYRRSRRMAAPHSERP